MISVAAALETTAHGRNDENNGDDQDDGDGVAVSIAAALSHAMPGLMGSLPLNGVARMRDHWQKRVSARIIRRTGITRRSHTAGASWLIALAALARGSTISGKFSALLRFQGPWQLRN
jgi:hypothetical protein